MEKKFNKIVTEFYDGNISLFRHNVKELSLEEAKSLFKWVEKGFPNDKYAILPILQEIHNYNL